jgi:ABC-type oligopeptide transport system ATPase subunit
MLEVRGLVKHFPAGGTFLGMRPKGWVKAVDGIDFTIGPGETPVAYCARTALSG